jgi:hypothetical protein
LFLTCFQGLPEFGIGHRTRNVHGDHPQPVAS